MPSHWLSPGAKTWSPDCFIAFDTETTEFPEGETLKHIIACWDAEVICRHDATQVYPAKTKVGGHEPYEIADLVETWSERFKELWIFAHNLNFDLAVTQLPAILCARRWTVEAYGLSKESNWWVLKRDGRKLVIADSWSWLPASLQDCGRDIARRKSPLPGTGDTMAAFHRRCRSDASILSSCLVALMEWWDAEQLGRWGITGAGCGWSAFRTKTGRKRIVVGPSGDRTRTERAAIFGGRKEVYRVGRFNGEWIADYDFQGAYPTIAAHHKLPNFPGKFHRSVPVGIEPGISQGVDVIAQCVVTTERPCVPCRIDHEVWWPVGTFATTLAGPEIAYARSVGATVDTGSCYVYKLDFALREWAVWCLELLQAPPHVVPPLIRRMAKGWSRSVIGRFGGHTSQITDQRPALGPDWRLEVGHNLTTGRPMEILTIGGLDITSEHDLEGTDAFPAVLAFVESHCRVALARTLDSRAPDRILQANTDGWWERRVVRAAGYELENVPWPHTVVRKALVNDVAILGPDHLTTPHERRLAGVPKVAEQDLDERFHWHDWPGLRWQLERATDGEYHRPRRELILKASYARRWVLDSGETLAITTSLDDSKETTIEPWDRTIHRRNVDRLASFQDERLMALIGDEPLRPVIFDDPGQRALGRANRLTRFS